MIHFIKNVVGLSQICGSLNIWRVSGIKEVKDETSVQPGKQRWRKKCVNRTPDRREKDAVRAKNNRKEKEKRRVLCHN